RHTQPLDPQTIVNMTRDMPQEQRRPPQPIRLPDGQVPTASATNTSASRRNVCPICKGAGYLRANVPVGDPNFGKPVACACKEAERREKRRQELLELSDLSAFQHSSFTNFNVRSPGISTSVKEAFKHALAFADAPQGWFVMIGPNGCGKTHLAAAIANQNLKAGAVVLFTVVPDLLAHLRSTFGSNATEAYDQRFAKMREAELLVLDDLGAHQSSPWASEKLFQLLNYRYNSSFPTVITANQLGLNGLDARILSRMNDAALVTTINMNGAIDYRPHNPRREPYTGGK
ncbi:MAG TPA: ATP-binding protein, partial [Ktedonobacteraceae bacterium]|nr:ATP-binding protein [Ktedonobacteraceae bacterium]